MARERISETVVDVGEGRVKHTILASGDVITMTLSGLEDGIVKRLALHGLKQKLSDARTDARDVADALLEGIWERERGTRHDLELLAEVVTEYLRGIGKPVVVSDKLAEYRVSPERVEAALGHKITGAKYRAALTAKRAAEAARRAAAVEGAVEDEDDAGL